MRSYVHDEGYFCYLSATPQLKKRKFRNNEEFISESL